MKRLAFLTVAMCLALASCTSDMPTAAVDDGAAVTTLAKGDNGAQIFRGLSSDEGMMMVDDKNSLLMIAYSNDVIAEGIFEWYDVHCDLPAADVQSEVQIVTNPSNDSGMWRFKGTTALAVYDYDAPLIFPPPEGIYCSDHRLVAYGVVDAYKETGNDFMFGADRTLTFGLTARGVINNAIEPGDVEIRVNARGMYRASDIHNGVFNSLSRNTNIRLSPDPRG